MTTDVRRHIVHVSELIPDWHVIDASGKILGRLSTEIATLLQGKHKPNYTPYLKSGDFVVVINSAKIKVSPKKQEKKIYYRHTLHPGGLKQRTLEEMLEKYPNRVIEHSVKGMLPKSRLGRQLIKRLKVYAGDSHPHEAQVTGSARAQIEPTKQESPPKKITTQKRSRRSKTAEKQEEA